MSGPKPGRLVPALLAVGALAGCGTDLPDAQVRPAQTGDALELSAATQQRLGVRTAVAELAPLVAEAHAVGTVTYDASTILEVYAPTDGWVDHASVFAAGEPVRSGDVLLELYSPSLATVDDQYLGAVAAGREPAQNPYSGGLRALGLTDDMIRALRAKERSPGHIPFRASQNGVVTELAVRRGAVVKQGDRLLQTAAIDPVWVNLALPQSAATAVAVGAEVRLETVAYPGRAFSGHVTLLSPFLDTATRTMSARVVVPNADGALKANMFVSAHVAGPPSDPVVQVPSAAVIRGERADRVIVVQADGRFARRSVVVGRAAGERVAITSGVSEGERVVTSGVFLIDAETNVAAGMQRLDDAESKAPQDSAPATDPHMHHR